MKCSLLSMPGKEKIVLKISKAFFCAFFLLISPFTASAATHIVEKGDTLYSISLRYNIAIDKIKEINGLTSHIIYPGQKLTISDSKKTKQITYKVKPGDYLYKIAHNYGISVKDIMKVNNLTSEAIYAGQNIIIPSREKINNLPSRGGSSVKSIMNLAISLLGSRYVYGGSGPSSFDCSGFAFYVFKAAGLSLPHNAAAQAKMGIPVAKDSLEPADLVFFSYYGSKEINHVGIYMGEGKFIHASSSKGVITSSLNEKYYLQNYRGARRLL